MPSVDENLSKADDALIKLFSKILDTLANTDVFSRSNSPSSFIVYAHNKPEKGVANAEYVDLFIQWLKTLRCRILSDRSPMLPWSRREGEAAAVESILSNQFCLLPASPRVDDAGAIISVDKVILCGSPMLRLYCKDDFTSQYLDSIQALHAKCQNKTRAELQRKTRSFVEKQCKREGFHHVLTELAFVKIRRSKDEDNHGIIPIALGDNDVGYLPFLCNSDHYLRLRTPTNLFQLHKLFFNLLQRLYTEERERITIFRDCYREASRRFQNKGPIECQGIIDEEISKAQDHWLRFQTAAAREWERNPRVPVYIYDTSPESKRSQFLASLSALPYQDRKNRNPERVAGTCQWFTNHERFKIWKDCKTSCLLWVSADPGCGKSVLARFLADDIFPTTDERTTCYFFFKDDFEDQKYPQNALCCLLHQLFLQMPSLLSDGIMEEFARDRQLLDSFDSLWRTFINVASHRDAGEIVIILDALDECEEYGRTRLVEALDRLYSDKDNRCDLKFLLTSRPYHHIQLDFQNFRDRQHTIRLSGENPREVKQISREINIVIKAKVKELSVRLQLQKDEEKVLRNELTRFPNRTYLWIYLIFHVVRQLLNQKSDLTSRDSYYKRSALSWACRKGHENIVELLFSQEPPASIFPKRLAMKIVIDSKDHWRRTPLWYAARYGNKNIVESLLNRRARIERKDRDGKTPLFVAAEAGRKAVVQILLNRGADIEAKDYSGKTPLFAAARWSDEDMLQLLLSQGASIEGKNKDGWTSLLQAARYGQEVMVQLLFSQGADIEARDNRGAIVTPPRRRYRGGFGRTSLLIAVKDGHEAVVQLLLGQGADTEAKHENGWTSLFVAADNGSEAMVQLLLDKGAHCNARSKAGSTPLLLAAEYGWRRDILELLLNKDADIEASSYGGETPLFTAVRYKNYEVIELLLERGANVNGRLETGSTPLLQAAEYDWKGNIIELLLSKGADIEVSDDSGETPLSKAVQSYNIEATKLLIDRVAEVKASYPQDPDLYTHDPDAEFFRQLLLEHGA